MKRPSPVRLTALAAALLAMALVAAGCGSSSDSSTGGTGTGSDSGSSSDSAPKAAAFVYTINDYTSVELEGLKQELKKVGGSLQTYSANFNPQEQLAQCQDAITSQRFNVLIIDAVDSPSAVPCATQAGEQGLKVISMENPTGPSRAEIDPQVPQVQGSVVIYPPDDAKHTFELVEEACKGISNCKWIVEIGTKTSPLDSIKLEYLEEQADKSSNIEIIQVLEANYDPSETAKKVPDALSANPDANVISFESDTNALAAIPAVEDAGLQAKVKLVGDGGSKGGAKAIENGTMFASVAAFPLSTGEVAGQMVIDALAGKEIKPAGVNMFDLGKPIDLTKETIGEYTSQWGAE